ncbi:MAG: DUF692 domain-containing protein [Gammaproteobacteria bacterium]|nr:DUF692 domain-containing protein [Gammaproteobacteria bacterium]
MSAENSAISGVGLGLRRPMAEALSGAIPGAINFMEVAPENWMGIGGKLAQTLEHVAAEVPLICHGLSLNLGGYHPLDRDFLLQLRTFLDRFQVPIYSEHLSYCGDHGHLYDLMPVPFTAEAVEQLVARIHQVEDILERPLVLENISYYAAPGREMSEAEFVSAVLEESGCGLLLDINNIYVNSINHGYSASDYLQAMPADRIRYLHVAGHYQEAPDLLIDTHGADIEDPVWALLTEAYHQFGVIPTLLERDFNLPPMELLLKEVEQIHHHQQDANNHAKSKHNHAA